MTTVGEETGVSSAEGGGRRTSGRPAEVGTGAATSPTRLAGGGSVAGSESGQGPVGGGTGGLVAGERGLEAEEVMVGRGRPGAELSCSSRGGRGVGGGGARSSQEDVSVELNLCFRVKTEKQG